MCCGVAENLLSPISITIDMIHPSTAMRSRRCFKGLIRRVAKRFGCDTAENVGKLQHAQDELARELIEIKD
jgi:hypothetical protein